MLRILKSFAAVGIAVGALTAAAHAADVKIGFVVKQPEEPWFQDEWKFADIAAKEKGFTLVKIGAEDGEKVQSAIDNLGAQGAQGFHHLHAGRQAGPRHRRQGGSQRPQADDR